MSRTVSSLPRLVYNETALFGKWIADRIPNMNGMGFSQGKAIGVVADNGKLMAGVYYNDYQPQFKTMQLHIASSTPMWARQEIIGALLAYPFEQLGMYKCWALIAEDNRRSINCVTHIGFVREAKLKHQFGEDKHGLIYRMTWPVYDRIYGGLNNG